MGTRTDTPLLTFEEFERLPDEAGKCELLKGELVQLPPAEFKHHQVAKRIYHALYDAVKAARARGEAAELGEVDHEAGYKLDDDGWVQPDISITHPDQSKGKYLTNAPAIAIEVISPGNRARHVDLKTKLYFQFGAIEVWHIYPDTRRAVVHTEGGSKIRIENEFVTTPLLPGFFLSIAEILSD